MSSFPPADQSSSAPPLEPGDVKEQAGQVASDAHDAAGHVAGVTKDQAGQVASEVKSQAKDLFAQTTSELKDQAGAQQQKAAVGLRSVSNELTSMADKSDGSGVASELVRNLAGRAGSAATWLDGRDPGSLLDEVKSFAARKPGTFIALAAGAGIIAGRLAKSLSAASKSTTATPEVDSHAPATSTAPDVAAPTSFAAVTPVAGERLGAPVEAVPASSRSDEYADTRIFDDLVQGETSARRPAGEAR